MTDRRLSGIRLGFQTKILLVYLAAALAVVFLAFAAGSYYVNRLQRANVADAVELAQHQATEVARRVAGVLTDRPIGSQEYGGMNQQIAGLLEFNLRLNRSVTWVGYFDAQGNCVVEKNSQGETIVRLPQNMGEPHNIELPTGVPGQTAQVTVSRRELNSAMNEHEVREAISSDGRKVGEIRMKVAESPIFLRMTAASESISGMLWTGCLILLTVFVAVYALVSRMFGRQMELVRHAERTERMAYVGTLASGLAHEIRNPLSSMNVNLEVLREELEEIAAPSGQDGTKNSSHDSMVAVVQRAGDLAARVQGEIRGLGTTLSHFLEFALPSKEGMTEFPLRGLLEEIIDLHREQCKQLGISLEVQGSPINQTVIDADRRLCHQALRNIVINAMQILENAIPKTIRIRVEPAGPMMRVTVTDSGPGIPLEKLETIFEAFVSGRKGGTGLGLALTKKIIEEHRGSIRASNNTDMPGATFTVLLPIRQL
jgi:signal transduction histidine kinase